MIKYMTSTQPSNVLLWNTIRHMEKSVSKFAMPPLKASSVTLLSLLSSATLVFSADAILCRVPG